MKKFRIRWKFGTLWGWQRKQQTVLAITKKEAISQIYPFTLGVDRIVSVEELK